MPAFVRGHRLAFLRLALSSLALALLSTASVQADDRREACKAAMNARIQTCTNDCTARALAAVPEYKDTNNNVKFGCLKGCAIGQIMQMRACVAGTDAPAVDPTDTNR